MRILRIWCLMCSFFEWLFSFALRNKRILLSSLFPLTFFSLISSYIGFSRCYWTFVPEIYLLLGFHILVKAHFFWFCDFRFRSLLSWQRYRHLIFEMNALSMLGSPLLILGGCADRWNSHWLTAKTIAQIVDAWLNRSLSSSCGALWWW